MKWNIKSAEACILRNGGKVKDRKIAIAKAGLKVWGAIDYLVNYNKYFLSFEEKKK